jgi:hypothetical protein
VEHRWWERAVDPEWDRLVVGDVDLGERDLLTLMLGLPRHRRTRGGVGK